jgi:hypothetical protein
MVEDIALLRFASVSAGMIEPLDSVADFSDALVVWVSLWSLSLKFIVPESVCSAVEPVVLAFSLKLAVAFEDVMVGLWFDMAQKASRLRRIDCGT